MDVDGLRVFSPDGGRAGDKVRPLAADHDIAVSAAELHLGMAELSLLVGDNHRTFKAEGLLEPVEGGKRVFVANRRAKGGTFVGIFHDRNLLARINNI